MKTFFKSLSIIIILALIFPINTAYAKGKTINANATSVSFKTKDGGDFITGISSAEIKFKLDASSTNVMVSVVNATDNVVYKKTIKKIKKNVIQKIVWNGKKSNGTYAAQGSYKIKIKAGNTITNTSTYLMVYAKNDFAGGTGSKSNPYLVENAEQFSSIEKHNNKYFKQTQDIDFGYNSTDAMFTQDVPFNGQYDGNNKVLSNYISSNALFLYVGSQGLLNNIVVKNGCVNSRSKEGGDGLSLLVYVNYGTLSNSVVDGTVNGNDNCALLVTDNYGSISNCQSNGAVSSNHIAAGLVTCNKDTGKIIDSKSSAHVITTSSWEDACSGGLVGINEGVIISCEASGTLEATCTGWAGDPFVSGVACTNNGIIQNSFYTGTTICNLTSGGSGTIQ